MGTVVRDRAAIEAEIADRKKRYDRLPVHFEARRIAEMRDIFVLVDELLAMGR